MNRLKGFYDLFQVAVWRREFDTDSLRNVTNDFAGDSDRFLSVGERKDQGDFLSNRERLTSFDKDSGTTYVRNQIFEGPILSSVSDGGRVCFPGMLSLVPLPPIQQEVQKTLTLDQAQKPCFLIFRCVIDNAGKDLDKLSEAKRNTGLAGLLHGICHGGATSCGIQRNTLKGFYHFLQVFG